MDTSLEVTTETVVAMKLAVHDVARIVTTMALTTSILPMLLTTISKRVTAINNVVDEDDNDKDEAN